VLLPRRAFAQHALHTVLKYHLARSGRHGFGFTPLPVSRRRIFSLYLQLTQPPDAQARNARHLHSRQVHLPSGGLNLLTVRLPPNCAHPCLQLIHHSCRGPIPQNAGGPYRTAAPARWHPPTATWRHRRVVSSGGMVVPYSLSARWIAAFGVWLSPRCTTCFLVVSYYNRNFSSAYQRAAWGERRRRTRSRRLQISLFGTHRAWRYTHTRFPSEQTFTCLPRWNLVDAWTAAAAAYYSIFLRRGLRRPSLTPPRRHALRTLHAHATRCHIAWR